MRYSMKRCDFGRLATIKALGTCCNKRWNCTEMPRCNGPSLRKPSQRGNTLTGLGAISDNLGQYPQALEYYEAALALQQMIQDRAWQGVTLNNIGAVYDNLGQYEVALGFYQDALVISQEIGDRAGEGVPSTTLAGVLRSGPV
jgi:tetratricopeptide (TPR) repeat protein